MRKAAARDSAESPVLNAATRAGALSGAAPDRASSGLVIFAPRAGLAGELQRASIDFAPRPARQFDRMRHRVLDAVVRELAAQEIVQLIFSHDLRARRRRPD